MSHPVNRRAVAKGAAWAIPTIAVTSAAPAVAASRPDACAITTSSCPPASSIQLKTGWTLFNTSASNYSTNLINVSSSPALNMNLSFTTTCTTGVSSAIVTPGSTFTVTGTSGTTYAVKAQGTPAGKAINATSTNDNAYTIQNWRTSDTLSTGSLPITVAANGASCQYTVTVTFTRGNSGSTSALGGAVS